MAEGVKGAKGSKGTDGRGWGANAGVGAEVGVDVGCDTRGLESNDSRSAVAAEVKGDTDTCMCMCEDACSTPLPAAASDWVYGVEGVGDVAEWSTSGSDEDGDTGDTSSSSSSSDCFTGAVHLTALTSVIGTPDGRRATWRVAKEGSARPCRPSR